MGPVAFVSAPFDPGHSQSQVELVVTQTVLGRQGDRAWAASWGPAWERLVAAGQAAGASLAEPAPSPRGSGADGPGPVQFQPGRLSRRQWLEAVERAIAEIRAGRLDKVVLARDRLATAEREIAPGWLLAGLLQRYPDTWVFAVEGLIGATPELLVRRDRGLVTSRVLAGTILRRGPHDGEDLARALSQSSKDLAEHEYAVASVASGLEPYCSAMNVPETPFVLRLPNVMHLASDITGVCRGDVSVLELARAVHPSAAVCGTPTDQARRAIRQLEGMDRGRYAGPVGWVGADGDGDIGIALRCGQLTPDRRELRLYAGCGIVADSQPEAEWSETEAKLTVMRQALGADD
jgi:menaquinone-specific isochorismate synthase